MFNRKIWSWILAIGMALMGTGILRADIGNIDTTDKWAWSEIAGWNNYRPTNGGATVADAGVYGYIWHENVGWIKLAYDEYPPYENTSATNWGVNNDCHGNLSGYGWSEIAGWINFHSTNSQVTVDAAGNFSGYAWGENVGWIHFANASPSYKVKTDWQETTVTPTITPTATTTPTFPQPPPQTPTPVLTATPMPFLDIVPSQLMAGFNFVLGLALREDITIAFDFYLLADTPYGPYTFYLDGRVESGIKALYRNVPGCPAPYSTTIRPRVILPATMGGQEITFYAVVVQAGKMPPVSRPSELTPTTLYVLMVDKKTVTVAY